ncbi:hypothetical protein [Dysosmobacter sp.]|uniref:hypothetical protein n=1 Tax=Dysosmobacter sp. TaxID=2591382 RepID=UPI0026220C2F|nr:hypothetical protein [Dysosmobacter sp.]
MADLLGAANRVPGYDVSNHQTAGAVAGGGDRQVQNVPDPTRVGRTDPRTEQQGADNPLQSDVPRYDSNLQTFLQRMRETSELPQILRKIMVLLRNIVQTPGLQAGVAQEIAQLMEMLKLDTQGFERFFMEQVHGGNRFSGPLFSLLRQAYGTLPGEHARKAVLEFARRYSDFSSTEHIGKSMVSLLRQMKDYLPKSWRGNLEELSAKLENGLAAGARSENLKLLEGELIPYLGSYVERTHDLGPLRDLLSLLILQMTRYENGSEEQMLQSFRQMEGYGGVLSGLNQLDDAAILKLLRENDFSRAAGSSFADALSSTAAKALQGAYGPDVRDAFSEIVRSLLVQQSVYMPINHLFFPLEWNGKAAYSELWVDPNAQERRGDGTTQEKVQFLFKLDLESLGLLEVTLAAREEQVELQIYGPGPVCDNGALIAGDLKEILRRHGFSGKDVRVSKLERPLELTRVFPNLFEGKQGVDVKI